MSDFQCIKGFTLKNGKHYGVHDIVTQQAYDKLPEKNKMNFNEIKIPEYDEDDIKVNSSLIDDLTNPSVDPYDQPDLTPDWQPDDTNYGGGSSGGAGADGTY